MSTANSIGEQHLKPSKDMDLEGDMDDGDWRPLGHESVLSSNNNDPFQRRHRRFAVDYGEHSSIDTEKGCILPVLQRTVPGDVKFLRVHGPIALRKGEWSGNGLEEKERRYKIWIHLGKAWKREKVKREACKVKANTLMQPFNNVSIKSRNDTDDVSFPPKDGVSSQSDPSSITEQDKMPQFQELESWLANHRTLPPTSRTAVSLEGESEDSKSISSRGPDNSDYEARRRDTSIRIAKIRPHL